MASGGGKRTIGAILMKTEGYHPKSKRWGKMLYLCVGSLVDVARVGGAAGRVSRKGSHSPALHFLVAGRRFHGRGQTISRQVPCIICIFICSYTYNLHSAMNTMYGVVLDLVLATYYA